MKGKVMKIKVNYIHNKQAVHVRGADWTIAVRNQSAFDYSNALLNGSRITSKSEEQQEGERGNY